MDEAWTTGVQLADAVIELLEQKKSFTRENLEQTYVRRRRESWVDKEAKIAADSRNGFQQGVINGLIGMAIAGFTRGTVFIAPDHRPARCSTLEQVYRSRISARRAEDVTRGVRRPRNLPSRSRDGALWVAGDSV